MCARGGPVLGYPPMSAHRWILPVLVSLAAATPGLADKVTLKNGRVQEGLVESEDAKQVVLRMESGKITLMKTMILSIERAGASAGGSGGAAGGLDAFLEGKTIPETFVPLAEEYRSLCKKRDEIARLDAENAKTVTSIKRMVADLRQLEKTDADLTRKISKLAPQSNPVLYNKYVDQVNAVRQRLNQKQGEIHAAQNELRADVPQISEYLGSVEQFRRTLESVPVTGDETLALLTSFREGHVKLESEVVNLPRDPASEAETTLVSAKLNGKAAGKFLVDASVSYTAVSHAFAKRLGLHVPLLREGAATKADGTEEKVRIFLIDMLEIGDLKLHGIDGAVFEKLPREGIDGILGTNTLAFLSVYMDPATRNVVMQSYRARPDLIEVKR